MKTIRILDLFCGAGGAAKGYHDAFTEAGYAVESVGVDIIPQKRYPYTFVCDDALAYATAHGWAFDFIHASAPCQAHSIITPDKSKHVDLIPHTRWVLESLGKPYVIENVGGARRALRNPIMICGAQLGLKVYRHRFFESSMYLMAMAHIPHRDNTPHAGHGVSDKGFVSVTGHFSGIEYCRMAMGIDWMTAKELSQAIPPTYTRLIGRQLVTYFQNQQPTTEPAFSFVQQLQEAA